MILRAFVIATNVIDVVAAVAGHFYLIIMFYNHLFLFIFHAQLFISFCNNFAISLLI
jgi:hypothetical protein